MRGKEVILPTQPARSGTVVVTIGDPVTPGQVDGTCARVLGLVGACDPGLVVCDVARVRQPNVATVDLLARLALIARRERRQMALAGVPVELSELLAFAGLNRVPGLCLVPERQAEGGEDALDVEEEGDPGDPVA